VRSLLGHGPEFIWPITSSLFLTFLPDGKKVTTIGLDGRMWNIEVAIARVGVPLGIVDAATVGRPLEFACHGSAIAFSPDGKHLLSGGEHGNLNL